MRFVIFTHSLISDWNHGNAHFLRGIATELVDQGHDVRIFEPQDGWSLQNLIAEQGHRCIKDFENAYPRIRSEFYDSDTLDLQSALKDTDAVIVHEWNPHSLVARIGRMRRDGARYCLFFHDTHHRSVTDPSAMGAYDLSHYDGVLAYGASVRDVYQKNGWARKVWTWHEAADTRVFRPCDSESKEGDLVWIGNWGDNERTEELREFLIHPVKILSLKARVYGVRYPREALEELSAAGIEYAGWIPNFRVPEVFARYRATVHIPRRPYASVLHGIPTIRPFEALACGIPLVSAPWKDSEQLFRPGFDFLYAHDGDEMVRQLRAVLSDDVLSRKLSGNGLNTIRTRHSCAHRVQELIKRIDAVTEGVLHEGVS